MKITVDSFGTLSTGETASLYTLENNHGLSVSISNYGAAIIHLMVPDKKGTLEDVVLAHASLNDYETNPGAFGALIGRNANRIRNAEVVIDDIPYELEKNAGKHNLHTGEKGLQHRLWDAEATTSEDTAMLTLFTVVGDLEDGFPGTLEVAVNYVLTNDNALVIEYHATAEKDTVINLTNHSYFNLAGHDSGSVEDHALWIDSSFFTPNDQESIPSGEVFSVVETPFDFQKEKKIKKALSSDHEQIALMGGLDHNFLLNNSGYRRVATLTHKKSGRIMHVSTDLPGVQVYSGNHLSAIDTEKKDDATYDNHDGICFETQTVPNATNMPWFTSPICAAGTEYFSTTTFRFETK